jgi:O-acetyl-ADP-ribose deacetylase (regulator of RNase III)
MKTVRGDLIKLALAGEFDVIIHGCNCQCTMGSGIAKSIRATFPEAYAADCETVKGDRDKLGTFSSVALIRDGHPLTVVNAYTQFDWHGEGPLADYDAIRSVMRRVKQSFGGEAIGYPLIGAGLAKGDWSIIAPIIEEELEGEDHTLVEFQP